VSSLLASGLGSVEAIRSTMYQSTILVEQHPMNLCPGRPRCTVVIGEGSPPIFFCGAGTISIWALPAIIAITFHEAAHGFAARLLGDDTAWRLGRVTFNPLKHIGTPGHGARAAR
jgi:hypothetical protein